MLGKTSKYEQIINGQMKYFNFIFTKSDFFHRDFQILYELSF